MEKNGTVYHGCFTKNRDGTNRIIEKNKACLFPTSTPFWKDLEDIPSGARTRSQEKNQKLVKKGEYNRYFKQKNRGNIRRWLEADDSEVHLLGEPDRFYVVR